MKFNALYFLIKVYRERVRERSVPNIHELTTRTVTVSRDQQSDGFGICVKGGKDAGNLMVFSHFLMKCMLLLKLFN